MKKLNLTLKSKQNKNKMVYAKPENTQNAKSKQTHINLNVNQHSSLRTAHTRVCIIVHNCRTQHSTEQFW